MRRISILILSLCFSLQSFAKWIPQQISSDPVKRAQFMESYFDSSFTIHQKAHEASISVGVKEDRVFLYHENNLAGSRYGYPIRELQQSLEELTFTRKDGMTQNMQLNIVLVGLLAVAVTYPLLGNYQQAEALATVVFGFLALGVGSISAFYNGLGLLMRYNLEGAKRLSLKTLEKIKGLKGTHIVYENDIRRTEFKTLVEKLVKTLEAENAMCRNSLG